MNSTEIVKKVVQNTTNEALLKETINRGPNIVEATSRSPHQIRLLGQEAGLVQQRNIGPEEPEISLGPRVIVGKFSTTFLSKMQGTV